MPPRVVIAPDSFKGTLDAAVAARALADGWRFVRPADDLVLLPQADGGEGTLAAVATASPGAELRSAGDVTGPDGRATEGRWLDLPDGTAVIELAQMSGLSLMAAPDPLGATTRGLGEVIDSALDAGATGLVIGLGGSASTDGGAGALAALGLQLIDDADRSVADGGGGLDTLVRIDTSALRAAPVGGVLLLCDVTAPLQGPHGAAAVFGPQKGATATDIETLDSALARFAALLGDGADIPGAGAAGGTAYGFLAAWGAKIEAGSRTIARLTGLDTAAASADVVITGEGRFDATSMTGKVVGNVLDLAGWGAGAKTPTDGVRTVVVAGQLATAPPSGVIALSLAELAGSVEAAIADPALWLRAAGAQAARLV